MLDKLEYNKGIVRFNSVLETQLNLLHNCLHQDGAKEENNLIEKNKADNKEQWLTQEQQKIVKYLSEQKDNLHKDYIDNLTALRIALLGS